MFKNKTNTNLFDKKITERKEAYEKLLKKELNNLDERIKSEKYNVDAMVSKTGLNNVYHDLINSKDKINSKYQREFNKTYHSMDVELNKLNKKIDGTSKLINYKYNEKKEQLIEEAMTKIM